jgi:hypothetical protein
MTFSGELQRDWRQFRLLSRDSVRRLLSHVVISRDADPVQFALWGTALAMCPPLLFSLRKVAQSEFLVRIPAERFEAMLNADRLFFLVYGMLAAALLAALTWEALYPDRTDQEIVGVLPVKPRTLAAARLSAAVAACIAFTGAVNLPAAILYSIASTAHPIVGALPRVLLGHVVAATLASAFVFLALVIVRGAVAICAGERIANRLAVILQLVTIVALVEVFLFLPAVLNTLMRQMQATGSGAALSAFPPIWFAALFAWIAEGRGLLVTQAGTGLLAFAAAFLLTAAISLGPAAWMGRRALGVRSSERASLLMIVARAVALVFARPPAMRSMFLFGVASLIRSRRHALYLAGYLGMAIAAAILGIIGAELRGRLQFDMPLHYLLVLPLVFMFFAVFGLRGALAIPTDIEANWPFRMSPPTVALSVRATRLLIMVFGIAPIVGAWLTATLSVWPAMTALKIAALDLMAGVFLTEIALLGWAKVPFATAHEPAPETLKSKLPWYIFFLMLFSRGGAALQLDLIGSNEDTIRFLALGAAAIAFMRIWQVRQQRLLQTKFDADTGSLETLNLSEALN